MVGMHTEISLSAKQVVAFIRRMDSFLETATYRLTMWLSRWWSHPLQGIAQSFRNAAAIAIGYNEDCYTQLEQKLSVIILYLYWLKVTNAWF